MPREVLPECHCGSGKESFIERDARGIELGYACDDCRAELRGKYRDDVLNDSSYECDEPIDPEPSVGPGGMDDW